MLHDRGSRQFAFELGAKLAGRSLSAAELVEQCPTGRIGKRSPNLIRIGRTHVTE